MPPPWVGHAHNCWPRCASRHRVHRSLDCSGEALEEIAGAGILDLYRATGGARKVTIRGQYVAVPGQTLELVAETDAVIPPGAVAAEHFNYEWTVDGKPSGNGRTLSIKMSTATPMDVVLVATDRVDGNRLSASHHLELVATLPVLTQRRLFSTETVADWATFFNGGRHNRPINREKSMPQGCSVESVRGILMEASGPVAGEKPEVTINRGNKGFTVTRTPAISNERLDVDVHQWHDGLTGVKTKAVYDILQPDGVVCAVVGILDTSP